MDGSVDKVNPIINNKVKSTNRRFYCSTREFSMAHYWLDESVSRGVGRLACGHVNANLELLNKFDKSSLLLKRNCGTRAFFLDQFWLDG